MHDPGHNHRSPISIGASAKPLQTNPAQLSFFLEMLREGAHALMRTALVYQVLGTPYSVEVDFGLSHCRHPQQLWFYWAIRVPKAMLIYYRSACNP